MAEVRKDAGGMVRGILRPFIFDEIPLEILAQKLW
jgi:hypothetical protein